MELSNETKKLHLMLEQTQQAVQKLGLALSASAVVQLAAEFYTKDERVELIKQYQGLQLTVQNARDVHNAGIEAKVESKVTHANFKALKQAHAMQEAFQQRHGLISALYRARTSLETPSRA